MDGERGQNHFELVSRGCFDGYKYLRHATYMVFALSCGGFFGDYFRDVKRGKSIYRICDLLSIHRRRGGRRRGGSCSSSPLR